MADGSVGMMQRCDVTRWNPLRAGCPVCLRPIGCVKVGEAPAQRREAALTRPSIMGRYRATTPLPVERGEAVGPPLAGAKPLLLLLLVFKRREPRARGASNAPEEAKPTRRTRGVWPRAPAAGGSD